MISLVNRLKKYKVKKILIDGALFRRSLASTSISDGVILSTGASYHNDMEKVVVDTASIVEQFKVDQVSENVKKLLSNTNCIISNENQVTHINGSWIHSNPLMLKQYLSENSRYLFLTGALTDNIVQALVGIRNQLKKLTIIVNDATHILCSGYQYGLLKKMKIDIKVLYKSHLLFVSYNPTSPYGHKFNNSKFKELLEANIEIPCINVLEDRK